MIFDQLTRQIWDDLQGRFPRQHHRAGELDTRKNRLISASCVRA